MIFLIYAIIAAGVTFLSVKAADYVDLIDKKTSLSGAFIGGIMLSAVTSLPELFTSLSSTLLLDEPGLCIGNILGSNIMNVLVILGLASAIVPIAVGNSTQKIDAPFMIAISAIFLALGWDGTITRLDGVVLLVLFASYIGYMICIFVLLTFVCYEICRFPGIKRFFADFGRMALFSILALGMTLVLTLPGMSTLLQTNSVDNSLEYMGGELGKGVVILTNAQREALLDKLGFDAFNHYVDKLSTFILEKDAKVGNHYQTILKWANEDMKL